MNDPDTRVARKISAARESSGRSRSTVVINGSMQSEASASENEGHTLIQPGTVTSVVSRKDSKVAAKIAAAGVGASSATDDSRVARKASRVSAATVGAVEAVSDDPAQRKKEANSHFVQNELFMNEKNEHEINPDEYLQQQVRSLKQDEEKKNLEKSQADNEQKNGVAAVPKVPGAYSVKGSKTGGWFTGGFLQRSRSMGQRNQSGLVVDSGITALTGELIPQEKTCWESVDKTALYAGGFLLVVVILAISIPLGLVNSAPPPPTPAPTLPRLPVYDSFKNVLATISGEKVLEDPQSAQFKALNWLVYDDMLALNVDDPSLLQRYTLKTIYFGNNGVRWSSRETNVWGSGVSECDWGHVGCVNKVVNELDFKNVGFEGTLSSELLQLTKLTSLDVSGNILNEGVFPTVLTQMSNLVKLDITETGMSGRLPDAIGDMTNLQILYCGFNSFTGELPATFKRLSNLVNFECNKNELSGRIFDVAVQWPELADLVIHSNKFSGTIPTEISKLSKLSYVETTLNDFTGSIPSELGLLAAMSVFTWGSSTNATSGSIPTELGNCVNLGEYRSILCWNSALSLMHVAYLTHAHA